MSASNNSTGDFDAFGQNFTLTDSNGHTVIASMADVDAMRIYGIRLAINYGSQIGASTVLLLILILLTKPAKWTSSIFIMNTLCLVLNILRTIFQTLWLTGDLWNVYSQLTGDTSPDAWQDRANTVTANTLTLCLLITIMTSLTMQVWVVCKAARTIHRALIIGITTTVALVAIGFRFTTTILSNMSAIGSTNMQHMQWVVAQTHIFQAIAIWGHCSVFACKLGLALIQRRRLGMTQFGPMQIVFIMSAHTMVIPAIFSVLQFYKKVPELGSQTLTVVCIFLPLSAIWAGVFSNDQLLAASGAAAHQRLLQGHFGHSPSTTVVGSATTKISTMSSSKDPYSPNFMTEKRERAGSGIHVSKKWSVEDDLDRHIAGPSSSHCRNNSTTHLHIAPHSSV